MIHSKYTTKFDLISLRDCHTNHVLQQITLLLHKFFYAIMHLVSTQGLFCFHLLAGGHISCFVRAHLQRWYNSESRCGSPSLSCSHPSTSCSSSSQPYTFFSPVTFHFFEFLTFFFLSQSSTGPYFFFPSCLLVTSVLLSASHVHV